MRREPRIQKKKTPMTTFLDILFKALIGIAVIIFAYVFYSKSGFSSNKISFSPKKKGYTNSSAPEELRWFNDFKGVENVPDKKAKKNSSSGSSGFKYQGFNK